MKLSDIKGEKALDVLADMLEPASEIFSDSRIADKFRAGKRIKGIKIAIKEHKKAVIEVFAALDGEDPEEYGKKINLLTIPTRALELLNEPEVVSLFSSPSQTESPSGDTSENTTAAKE